MTSLTTSHLTNTTDVTTPESAPRQGQPDITARWTRWVLVGAVSVGLVGAAGVGYWSYGRSHTDTAPAGTARSLVSSSRVDAAESAHGSGSSIRSGVDAPVSGTLTGATVVPDAAQMVHGIRGSLVTGIGASATQPLTSAAAPRTSEGALLLHGTRGSLEDATGQPAVTR